MFLKRLRCTDVPVAPPPKPWEETIVSIEGNIGSGKSTLISALQREFSCQHEDIRCLPEPVDDWIPILTKFYNDPPRFSLAASIRILLSYCDKQKFFGCVTERSPFSSRYIFTQLQHDSSLLDPTEFAIYDQAFQHWGWQPDITFYVNTPPDVCLQRIRQRGRECENQVTLDYLGQLHQYHDTALRTRFKGRILIEVDGTQPPVALARAVADTINTLKVFADIATVPQAGVQFVYRLNIETGEQDNCQQRRVTRNRPPLPLADRPNTV